MQYLSLALYAEGPTDYRFLSPLLQRLCEDICLRDALDLVEVSEVLALEEGITRTSYSGCGQTCPGGVAYSVCSCRW